MDSVVLRSLLDSGKNSSCIGGAVLRFVDEPLSSGESLLGPLYVLTLIEDLVQFVSLSLDSSYFGNRLD